MLGLNYPGEDYRVIRDGLASDNVSERASAEELIETLLSTEVARGILGLATEGSIAAQRTASGPRVSEHMEYAELVRSILDDGSRSLRAVALYHAGEIGILDRQADSTGSLDDATAADGLGAKERGLAAVRDLFDLRSRAAIRTTSAR